jgi:prepilin-type N-terminal cleavage/methylation domain-containing protein
MSGQRRRSGFTLVELSIVIIIVGLIVTGVIGGQRLIQQAKLRTVVSDKADVETAVNNFRSEYNALPGDMKNASSFWDACGGSDAVCDGDGNKKILHNVTANTSESYAAWVHLGNSGHYPGSFTGAFATGGVVNVTAPEAGFRQNVVLTLLHDAGLVANSVPAGMNFTGNLVLFGGTRTNALADKPFLKPSEAYGIDKKIDDGLPASGRAFAVDGAAVAPGTYTGADQCFTAAGYNVSDTIPAADPSDPATAMADVATEGCGLAFSLGN